MRERESINKTQNDFKGTKSDFYRYDMKFKMLKNSPQIRHIPINGRTQQYDDSLKTCE